MFPHDEIEMGEYATAPFGTELPVMFHRERIRVAQSVLCATGGLPAGR
jgi:hypothetical protein